jgi:ribonuclease HI
LAKLDHAGYEKILAERLRSVAEWLDEHQAPSEDISRGIHLASELEQIFSPKSIEELEADDRAARASAAGEIRIWCDGSCAPNPGPGGWGAIIERDGAREEISGASPDSTNNIMELTAAIQALRHIPSGAKARVTTDSRYVVDGMSKWIAGWKRKGWRKADGQPVLNRELWMELDALARERKLNWHWVEAHAGDPDNERADELANLARQAQFHGAKTRQGY